MTSWQEWEAERKARSDAIKAKPCYGGNKIPKGYLKKHNQRVGKYVARLHGIEYKDEPDLDAVPDHIARFARLI